MRYTAFALVFLSISGPWSVLLAQDDSLERITRRQERLTTSTRRLEKRVRTNEQDIINVRDRVRKAQVTVSRQGEELQDLIEGAETRFVDLRSRATILETRSQELEHGVEQTQSNVKAIREQLQSQGIDLSKLDTQTDTTKGQLDRFWVLISAALVFLMQAGFKSLEVGLVRSAHRGSVGVKNLIDWLVVSVIFYLVGFGLMYGESQGGVIGLSLFAPSPQTMPEDFKLEFFLFQLAFAGTAATIVSGAISERSALSSYLFASAVISAFIYPIFGHWAWGGGYLPENTPWLANIGFHDFAGGTVVHGVGAWVALVGVWFIGPRLGRFDPRIEETGRFNPSDIGYSVLGVFILWAGWWGFNGGSVLAFDDRVSVVILSTNLAGAAAGIAAFLHSIATDRKGTFGKLIGGTLGGLVAITPCADVVSSWDALVIGCLAGIVHNLACNLLVRLRLDDPVGAIPVHGFCGALGTLAVGIFARSDQIERFGLCPDPQSSSCVAAGLLSGGGIGQLAVQFLGVMVAFLLSVILAVVTFWSANTLIGLRVSQRDEESGFALLYSDGRR